MAITNRKEIRQRIHLRVRKKVRGTAERPRLAVFFSNKNVTPQIINDDESKTICLCPPRRNPWW
jgi:large subunit ribosomal protein L18